MSSSVQASSHQHILLTFDKVKALLELSDVAFIDGRPYVEYKNTHIQGAISLPIDETFAKPVHAYDAPWYEWSLQKSLSIEKGH